MPLIHGYSAKARSANIKRLVSEGYPQKQAVAIAYDVARKARANVDDELGDILSRNIWVSPFDAKEALDTVHASAMSLDVDMRQAAQAGKLPPAELAEWQKWLKGFVDYYNSRVNSFAMWRLLDSKAVLTDAERLASDLTMWRQRFLHFTGSAAVAQPLRISEGDFGPGTVLLIVLATIGAWQLYKSFK